MLTGPGDASSSRHLQLPAVSDPDSFLLDNTIFTYYNSYVCDDAWLSLVERCVRDAEAAGSNPVASMAYLQGFPASEALSFRHQF